eukprot:TRINITY_DN1834_c0_g1_i4.p1 TRINITY_DN1834_c0_g1~~TRINITY_DN1834_c0_g1_i4.p1  ORF type:complete len:779 (+),score=183.03 TRINITY_DN1834_c0_g1_i4:80-2416(+)
MRVTTGLLPLLAGGAAATAAWRSIPCPSGTFRSQCSYTNTAQTDEAVSLFFQFEPAQGESSATFSCTGDGLTYCARSWQAEASGSAGDCWFVLGAGRSFSCSGQGTVNVLGAHAMPMTVAAVSSSAQGASLGCSGKEAGKCSYTNGAHDAWVGLAFSAPSNATLSCKHKQMQVCSWAASGPGGGGSCGFLLPAGAQLHCQGNAQITAAAALPYATAVADSGAKLEPAWNCPNVTYPNPNLCDCSLVNNHTDKDLLVSVAAQSVDGNYNSFHCGIGSANVCAWGSNRDDEGDAGSCFFILPAGAEFSCQMEWGAAAFSYSSAVATKQTLFAPAQPAAALRRPVRAAARAVRAPGADEELRRTFAEWQVQHGRRYVTQEEHEKRFANFRQHVALAGPRARYNNLADLSQEEFERSYRGCGRAQPRNSTQGWRPLSAAKLPTSVDWRTKSVVTPVKDQGQCGSCWSFSTTGAIESAWAIAGHKLTSLSEQELVSCDNRDGNAGCGGGWPDKAMDYVKTHGIDTEASYPYASAKGTAPACSTSGHIRASASVAGHQDVANDEDAMVAYVAQHGPLSICVAAMTQLWWPYTGGIMSGCCNTDCDHAVLIVGYGEEKGTKYWLIKNSWNENWGEGGYLRLERGTNQCGITTAPVGVLVGGSPTPPTPPGPSPSTPQPPTPPSSGCPAQAVKKGSSCMWVNGTNGVVMPPPGEIQEYCDYFSQGYFGYLWAKSGAQYDCPTAAGRSSSDASVFCVFDNNQKGVQWPQGAKAECGGLRSGTIGYSW